jgi:uncharacterized protein YodC (DUF2158 family)
MSEFVAGDVVQLKSGGPMMTIEKIEEENVVCIWVTGDNIIRGTFNQIVLKK